MATDLDSRPFASSEEIQGNILAPFRCDHQAFVFLNFHHQRDGARRWLGDVTGRVSTTKDAGGAKEPPHRGLGLTATGMVVLHPEVAATVRVDVVQAG